ESFGGLAAADAAGDVILAVDHIVPQREHGALVVYIAGLRGHVRHARIGVGGAYGVSHGLVLFLYRHPALIIIAAAVAVVEQELGQPDIGIAVSLAFHVVDETPE